MGTTVARCDRFGSFGDTTITGLIFTISDTS